MADYYPQIWRAQRTGERGEKASLELRDDLERLYLITQALWTLLKEEHHYSDEELMLRIEELDLADGRRDGRAAPETRDCPKCGRKQARSRESCVFCGTELERGVFDH